MIALDLRNTDTRRVGRDNGIDFEREFGAWRARLEGILPALRERSGDDAAMLGWLDLPRGGHAAELRRFAAAARERYRDLVVLGIGGSSLGGLTVITALQHPYRLLQRDGAGLRVHFVDNIDPDQIHALMQVLDPTTTLVNVISKSGSTAETMAAYLAFKGWLQQAEGPGYRERIVVTTDPQEGLLRELAASEGYAAFAVPPSVGGRFSVLSAVGLLPAALAGLDPAELLLGAAQTNELATAPLDTNPVLQAALVQYLSYRRGKRISVLMPYSARLRYLPNWFVQLWAESLGKAVDRQGSVVHEGSTPLPAIGASDQHSQVQLFNEGPNDKLIAFVRLGRFDHEVKIPDAEPGAEGLAYLAGQSFNRLIGAEQAATAHALAEHGRPNYTIRLPELSARTLGGLLQFLMLQTAVMGELTNIDTYDQPGVELGKRYTYALMGRPGFEEVRAHLEEAGVEG